METVDCVIFPPKVPVFQSSPWEADRSQFCSLVLIQASWVWGRIACVTALILARTRVSQNERRQHTLHASFPLAALPVGNSPQLAVPVTTQTLQSPSPAEGCEVGIIPVAIPHLANSGCSHNRTNDHTTASCCPLPATTMGLFLIVLHCPPMGFVVQCPGATYRRVNAAWAHSASTGSKTSNTILK